MAKKIYYHLIILIASIGLTGSMVYRLYSLNYGGVFFSLIIGILIYIIQLKLLYFKPYEPNERKHKILPSFLFCALYCCLFAWLISLLFKHQATASLSSPWQVLPNYIFFIFFGLMLMLILLALFWKPSKNIMLPLLSLSTFSCVGIALTVYETGFGFDPYIHQATLDIISQNGFILPKPFYYIGQYAIEIIVHKLFFIPIPIIDRLLVPVLASLLLPITMLIHLSKTKPINLVYISSILSLIIPLSYFIVTTPQHLAYLFLTIIVLIANNHTDKKGLSLLFLLSIFAIMIHPIAGIGSFLFVSLLLVNDLKINRVLKNFYTITCLVISIIAIPSIFYFVKGGKFYFDLSQIINSWSNILIVPRQANWLINFTYTYIFNLPAILAMLVGVGIFLLLKYRKMDNYYQAILALAAGSFLSYLLMTQLSMEFLIDYERLDYANRLLGIGLIFSSPFIVVSLKEFAKKLLASHSWLKVIMAVIIAGALTISWYNTYPRNDAFFNSKSFSAGELDLAAVKWIENDSNGEDYIALANQQVSVMALNEYGFNRYYQDDIYFYPLPTSCPLYEYYLKMVYEKADRETMVKAMNLANVDLAYFVLNKYWWAFPKISAEAQISADSTHIIGDENIIIYKYEK